MYYKVTKRVRQELRICDWCGKDTRSKDICFTCACNTLANLRDRDFDPLAHEITHLTRAG